MESNTSSPGNSSPRLSGNNLLMVSVLIGAAFIVGMFYNKIQSLEQTVSQLSQGSKTTTTSPTTGTTNNPPPSAQAAAAVAGFKSAGEVEPVSEQDHVRGDRNARIMLIEYSDFECPFCKRFHPTAQQVVDTYGGQVAWVYRHFPLVQLHSKAPKEAEASECVADLGGEDKFWEFADKIFEVTPANNGLDPAQLPELAGQVGVNKTQFQTCLDSGKFAQNVQIDLASGQKAGVNGTPGNVILDTQTGKTILLPGAYPYDQVKQAIDSLLQG